jgi:hypothetical protein
VSTIGGNILRVIIDRFEGEFAIVELDSKKTINMSRDLVPKGAKEGDVLTISIDYDDTNKRRKQIDNLMNKLWK